MRVFRCVLLFLLVHHRTCATGDGDQLIPYSDDSSVSIEFNSPLITNTVQELKSNKFPLRKCCPPGKVYHHFSHGGQDTKERCRDHANAYQQSSSLIEISQQLFFSPPGNGSANYNEINFNITSGFPEHCEKMMLLEPDAMPSDRFYPLLNGDLVVPHRFWIFPPESHCMEDFFADEDYSKIKRVAIICADKVRTFPNDAIDDNNRLQLNFLDDINATPGLTGLSGNRVIRKCCDFNEVYSVLNHTCIPKQTYATQFFDDLLSDNENLFLRTGVLNCSGQQQPDYFEWTEDRKLRVQMILGEEWENHLYTSEEYCVDDFVIFLDDELPETINVVTICPVEKANSQITTETSSGVNVTDETITLQDLKVSHIPKCCPQGLIVDGESCEEIPELNEQITELEQMLLTTVRNLLVLNPANVTVELFNEPEISLGCGYSNLQSLRKNASFIRVPTQKFRANAQHETTLHLSYYQENNWEFDVKIAYYCVDTKKIQSPEGNIYEPHVFFCFLPSHISGQYPALLLISSTALILTFVMYCFTPANGVASSDRPQSEPCQDTMACLFSGRNLLCHISSLCLAFVCLAVAQQGLVKPGDSGCIAIGYITYGATIASFAWFTVYCFHSFCMFRETPRNKVIFVPYLLFGWGIPAVALVIAVVAQHHPKSNLPHSINPNMGSLRCWFANETSSLVFFYVPVCFLLGLNMIFLISLLLNSDIMRCRTRNGSKSRSIQSTQSKEKFGTAIKFLIITGIPWVFEIAAWMQSYFGNVPKQRELLWYLSEVGNVLNALRGVFIFLLFVLLQPNVRGQLFYFLLRIFDNTDRPPKKEGHRTVSSSSGRNTTSQNSTVSSVTNNSFSILPKSEEQPTPKVQPTSFEPCEVTAL